MRFGPAPNASTDQFVDLDRINLGEYQTWLRETDRAAFDRLFAFGTILLETDEIIAGHQEMVAQFIADTAPGG